MQRRTRWFAIVILCSVVSGAMAQDGAKKPADPVAATLVGLMNKTMAAWATLDPTQAAPFYAKDPGLVFFDIAPLEYNGWSEYEAGAKMAFAGFSALQVTITNPEVHPQGSWAWGTAEMAMTVTMKDGTKMPLETRWTGVWEKRGKDWLIVHEHVSTPLQMPAPSVPAATKP